jgi:hypothetical protein
LLQTDRVASRGRCFSGRFRQRIQRSYRGRSGAWSAAGGGEFDPESRVARQGDSRTSSR